MQHACDDRAETTIGTEMLMFKHKSILGNVHLISEGGGWVEIRQNLVNFH